MKRLSREREAYAQGGVAMNVLRLASNVANGETITVGPLVFEIDIINTDSAKNTTQAITDDFNYVLLAFTAHGRKVHDLIRIENEIMRVVKVHGPDMVEVSRANCGTTKAAHVTDSDIFVSDAAPASNYPVGLVATLTPTAAAPAIVDTINEVQKIGIVADAPSVNEIVVRTAPGGQANNWACAETLGGANNAWAAAAMYGGGLTGDVPKSGLRARAANATEVALDHMLFEFPFTVGSYIVQVRTAAGALKTWDGAATASGRRVTVGNGGAADWAATDVVTVLASE